MWRPVSLFVLLAVASCAPGLAAAELERRPAAAPPPSIDPWVRSTMAAEGEAEMLLFLDEQADLSAARRVADRRTRREIVVEALWETASRTQPRVLRALHTLGVDYRPFWVANMIWVRAGAAELDAIAAIPGVRSVNANPRVKATLPKLGLRQALGPLAIEASLTHVGADDFWSAGFTGQGVVVGGQDTGYDWDHPALIDSYRGWDGETASHDYNWHDAIHSDNAFCSGDSAEPCDDHGHGTHTMGTMVGDDGAGNRIGMAPGGRWIGCRNMDQGDGTPASYSECFQWFMAPTDSAGQNPDPSKAPDVINNSWGCPPTEGCTDPTILQTVVENTRAAGIVVVVSAGNAGSSCESVASPPAIYDASFSVGSTDLADDVSGFSSRGPVTVDGSGRMKPDLVAPGESIRSSVPGGGYGLSSGTSMAGPHVAGLVALVLSELPCLRGDVDAVEAYLRYTAQPVTSGQTCGGVPGSEVPNNTYGYGAARAVRPPSPGCPVFFDGFETGGMEHWTAGRE